ncbi:MAG TPA: efflux RND transporter periplasmic adaptor subunit [Candidatus Parabacteroides intestinigallinarum]|uniref:Efflux RND transporter periplasmic adaptor subunit n=1 Tax=Candidatus Parabacteroides intestinigallinarum TaxID=2838722 RepID=A0A9D1XR48_9BACT|nr:efflux RND transporter periplasmic adaptor subunit [Candidatus Parabacteroides intestinigallinarum]
MRKSDTIIDKRGGGNVLWAGVLSLFMFAACHTEGGQAPEEAGAEEAPAVESPAAPAGQPAVPRPSERYGEGVVEANRMVSVYSQLASLVIRSNAREGEWVRKGDLLFQLDTEEYEDQIRQLEVSLREKELAWRDILIGQGYAWEDTASVPRQKLEFARVKSGYASTLVQYEIAVRKLRKTRVEAPSSGFIYDLRLYPNDYAKTTEPCCTIVDTEWLDVVFYILERDLKELSVGERIAVTPAVDKACAYEATITYILPIVDENGMIKVKARLTDPEGLWPGMSVMIHM